MIVHLGKKKKPPRKRDGGGVDVFSDITMMSPNFTLELLKWETEKQKFDSRSLGEIKILRIPSGMWLGTINSWKFSLSNNNKIIFLCLVYIPGHNLVMSQKLICLWRSDSGESDIILKEYMSISAHLTTYSSINLPVSLRKKMKHDSKVQVN